MSRLASARSHAGHAMMSAMSSASGPPAAPSPETPVAAEPPPLSLGPVDPNHAYRQVGYVFAAVGALLFSTKGIAIKLAYREAGDAETLLHVGGLGLGREQSQRGVHHREHGGHHGRRQGGGDDRLEQRETAVACAHVRTHGSSSRR